MHYLIVTDKPLIKNNSYEYSIEELTLMEETLLKEKQVLEHNIQQLRALSDTLMSSVTTFSKEMLRKFPEEHSLLDQLKVELQALLLANQPMHLTEEQQEQLLQNLRNSENLKDSFEKSRQHNENLAEEGRRTKKHPEIIKRLFKKIAGLTHPDKTSKKASNKLFKLAKQAFVENNQQLLERIYFCISRNVSWDFILLEDEVKELKLKEFASIQDVNNLGNSDLYHMAKDYTSNFQPLVDKATFAYIHNIRNNTNSIKSQINRMDPSKYPPDPNKETISNYIVSINFS